MSGANVQNRWTILICAMTVMLTIGTIYSWAMFTQPLVAAFHWDIHTTTWAYAIANFSLAAVGAVVGGYWQDKAGPRKVAVIGVALWGVGNMLAGLGTSTFGPLWLYITYGMIGGIGAGMAYITPVAMVTKWFPDRRGLAGGLAASGFGLGTVVYNQIVPRLDGFHVAALHAGAVHAGSPNSFTLEDTAALMHVFLGSGAVFLLLGTAAALQFRNPPDTASARRSGEGFSPSQMVAMPQFYLLWTQLFINVIGGITIISNAVYILNELTKAPATRIAPLFGAVFVFNVLGRCFWGAVSDRVGCNKSFAAMLGIQAATLFALSFTHDLTHALIGTAVVLLCCGGAFGAMPSFNASYFGTKYLGLNYALILTAWGFAGLIGPTVVATAKDMTGSFAGMLPLMAALLLASVILPFVTKKPAARPVPPAAQTLAQRISPRGLPETSPF